MKFKKFLCLTLATTIAFTATLSSSASIFADETVLSGEKETYVVLTETAKNGKEIISDYDGEALYSNEAVSCELTERQADKLEDQPGVLAVSEDIILTGTGKQIKDKKRIKNEAPEQWNLDAIGVSESDAKSSDVKIEVLDSGVSYTDDINIQSSVNLVPGEEEVSPMFVDANGHGTGIAGLIGAKDNNDGIKGVYPNAEIYSVKALDENLKSPLSRIVEGIYWGIENDMDIINMSFGTSVNTDVLHEAVKAAADAGIILIAAAGNTEHQNVNYPAAYNEVIAVGSINAEGELAELTSTGTQLELLAPGEQVYTTGLFYGTIGVSGTSIATAQVTGTAALLKAKDKTKSADFIRGLLKASSKEVAGTGARLIDYNYALDIYDEYEKNYIEGENIDNEFENTEEIPDYSDNADVVVEGLWSASGGENSAHAKLIKTAASSYKEYKDNISLLAYTCNLADSKYGKNGNNFCASLHSAGNYAASLKFLWAFSKNLGNKQSTSTAKTNALNGIPKKLYDENSDLLKILVKCMTGFINNLPSNTSAKKKKYYIIGFATHLLGDLYAHRLIVPNSATKKNTDGKRINKFLPSDFKNYSNFRTKVDKGVIQFRDIKNYTKNGKASDYEDNVNFISKRYKTESECAIESFFAFYKDKINIPLIIEPVTNLKLGNYSNYINAIK